MDHDAILRALSRALEATENAYLEMADKYVILLQLLPLTLLSSWGHGTVDYKPMVWFLTLCFLHNCMLLQYLSLFLIQGFLTQGST